MSDENTGLETSDAGDISGASKPARRLTDADFAEIVELYELGKAGLSELAETYGVSRQALSKRFKDAGVVRGSRAHEVAATTKKAATGAPSTAGGIIIERFADKRPGWIEETKMQGYGALKMVQQLAQKIVADHMRRSPAGAPAGTTPAMAAIEDDLKAVQRFGKILNDNLAARLDLLDADNFVAEEDLPSLVIEDVTDEEILEVFKNNGFMPEDATIEDMEEDRRELEAVLSGEI